MTLKEELWNLTKLELDILVNGEMKPLNNIEPWEDEHSIERLEFYHFYELQNKYTYGWYIASDDIGEQLKSIAQFKMYIIENYKEG